MSRLQGSTTCSAHGPTTWLYYLASGTNATKQAWTVQKLDATDPEIHYGDQICFLSRSVTDQTLQPIWNATYKTTYLTTKVGAKSWWTISK